MDASSLIVCVMLPFFFSSYTVSGNTAFVQTGCNRTVHNVCFVVFQTLPLAAYDADSLLYFLGSMSAAKKWN